MPVVLPNKTNQEHQSKSNGKNKPLLRPQDSQSSRSLGRCKDAQGCQKWVILPLVVQYLTASTGKFGLGEPKKPHALYWCILSYAWVCSVLKTPNTFAKVGYIACLDSCFFRRLAAPKSRVLHSHQPFPTVKHHLKLPKGTANSISRNTFLNPLNPIIFSYPPVIKLMAMENPRSSEVLTGKSSKNAGLTIEAIAMFDYWRGHKKKNIPAASDISTRSYRCPWIQLSASCHARGRIWCSADGGRFCRTLAWEKTDGPAMGGIPDPAPHPASSNGSMPGRSVKVTYGDKAVRLRGLPGDVGWEADHRHCQSISGASQNWFLHVVTLWLLI